MDGAVCVIGYLAQDIVFRTKSRTIREDLTEGSIAYAPGGTAVNVGSWLASLNATAELVVLAGVDSAASSMVSNLESLGVRVTTTTIGRTPVVLSVVVSSGERQLLVDNGGPFDKAEFPRPRLPPAWVHVPGHVLMREDLSEHSRLWLRSFARGIPCSVDVCSASRVRDFGAARFLALLSELRVSVLLMNELEAAALGGPQALTQIAPVTVVHNGANASQVCSRGEWEPVSDGIDRETRAIDSTGAGDAFAAGFIVASMTGASARAATIAGHKTAQAAIALVGGNPLNPVHNDDQ